MSALDGLAVRRTTTAQQLADGLAERIMAGAFGPGDRLRESAIAAELGVARNTIREAVRILELTGLVRYEVNRGAVVIAPTPEIVEALYTARERLETAAAARTPRPEQLDAITEAFENLCAAADTGDLGTIVDRDLAFHQAIVAVLDSTRLDEFYAAMTKELRFYLTVLSKSETPEEVVAQHRLILDAIRAGDRDRAVAEIRAHIDTSVEQLKQLLDARR
ncbi:GntR family transcriptional regulator [Lentzea flava]|uniref:GntR family transcriptional regulator n=1 Tax=Lentzea flava TaxID=103732 RepID=A0ABQ2UQN5_9PSEU|nr:GntR family transcriptional regulator [Lentzea flava]MCP2201300.1 DNA-binding transcriptional regulator, GntR family [Lentzea flava]GGU49233.1 GntR family transcriptional regulator [Lentzea flava]